MREPLRLVGSGRSADIFDFGEGRVLRRSRTGPIDEMEPLVMRRVRASGYPAPEVHSFAGADLVMDLVEGDDLLSRLSKRPWEARKVGNILARLHRQLAAVPLDATDVATQHGQRESFVHGDLHPGNVLLSSTGPMVIDWEGAGVGPRDADVATTWLLLETADADDVPALVRPLVGIIRRTVLRTFLAGVEPPRPATIAAVCADRLADPNMRPQELARIRLFASKNGDNGVT